ncbi:MAG TPA: hypothetical protein V6D23_17825 [Candidatus Obscuribacterales bacterium]
MDAQQIAQINQLKANQSQTRFKSSNLHCDKGFACLAKALETPELKQQKPLLLEACDAFAQAISFQRTNPEAYIGFAYVLTAIGNQRKAMGYVKEAQRLQPAHPEVQPLLDYLQSQASAKLAPATPTPTTRPAMPARPVPGSPVSGQPGAVKPLAARPAPAPVQAPPPPAKSIDYDELYDQIELEIVADVKILLLDPTHQATPSRNPQQISQLAREIKELKDRKAYFEQQLKIIDAEIDTAELIVKLKPFEQIIRRFENSLEVSRQLAALCQEIEEQDKLARQTLEETKSSVEAEDVPIIEENLEVLLDQSDLFANRLDELEGKGPAVEEGVKLYTRLIKAIEELQDALEDCKVQFGLS